MFFADGIHLINPHQPSKRFHALMEQTLGFQIPTDFLQVASACLLHKSACAKKDIMLAKSFQEMEVLAFVRYNREIYAFVRVLEFV